MSALGRAPGEAAALVVLTVAFLVSRIGFLDRDLPPWAVAQLQPLDEFYYTISAFNLFHYGSVAHRVVDYVPSDAVPLSLLENGMTATTLGLFGNNYFGLRMASVLAGLTIFAIVYVLLKRHLVPEGFAPSALTTLLPVLLLGYLVADFGFDMAARVAEPSIFQMLAVVLVLLAFSLWPKTSGPTSRAFWLGVIAMAAWLFVYILNAFVVPAVLLALVFESRTGGIRRIALSLLAAVAGCGAAAAAYALVVQFAYQQSLVQLYRMDIQGRSQLTLAPSSLLSSAWLQARAADVLTTDIFRFDMPVLLAFELALPVFLFRMLKEREGFAILIAALIASLVLQFTAVPDWPQRKLVILSPLVVIVVAMALPYIGRFMTAVRSSRPAVAAMLVWVAASEFALLEAFQHGRGSLDPRMDRLTEVCVALSVAVLLAAVVLGRRFSRTFVAAGTAAAILPGLYASYEYLWTNPTFRYRDAMAASAPYLDGHVVAGEYSYEFRLYNTSEPILDPNHYEYSDLKDYFQYRSRLFGDGTAQCLVANADQQQYEALGLTQIARYEIDAEGTPAMGIYCRSS